MAKAKIETQISSDNMKSINDICGTIWKGVFSVIDALPPTDDGNEACFSGEEASKVAGACRKAAERALTKLLSVPVVAEPSDGDDMPAVSEPYSNRLAPSAL